MTNNARLVRVRYVLRRRNRQLVKLRRLQDQIIDVKRELSMREVAVFTLAKAHDLRVRYGDDHWSLIDD
jgi:hypothetical protein